MANAKQIDEFIRGVFELYSLNYAEFFEDEPEDDASDAVDENTEYVLNMPMIEEAAKILGVDVADILNMDDAAVTRWFDKYPYFNYKPVFNAAYRRSFHDEHYDSMHLLEVIFDKPIVPDYPTRYDYDQVVQRLIATLKSCDEVMPGAYHTDATMQNLSIHTQNFCHFDKIGELVESYIDMFNRVKELFFKAWNADLSSDEIHEYNFLVAAIGIQDKFYTHEYLFYDHLRDFIPVYKDEGFEAFSDFVRIWPLRALEPWKCAEFSQNKELVQRFVEIYPAAKKAMREFSLQVSKFSCYFTWSDAKPTISTQAELDELNATAAMLGEEPVTFDNCGKEPTLIYVPKTKEELNGDDAFAEQLNRLSGPVSLGGVYAPKVDTKLTTEGVLRIQARFKAKTQKREGRLHE